MEAVVEKRWSVTAPDLQAWTYTILDCQLRTMPEKRLLLFFRFVVVVVCFVLFCFFVLRTTVFLVGPHAVCPFGMAN